MKIYSDDISTKEQHDKLAKDNEEQINMVKNHIEDLNNVFSYQQENLNETQNELNKVRNVQFYHILVTTALVLSNTVLAYNLFK